MYKVSFVILHYMSYDFSNECIESILKNIKYSNYNIIVVDNNSTNDSYIRLREKYDKIKNVYFIKNDDNLGFAKGNNVGYRFAKYKLNSDFIILLNNDTIIEQENFIDIVINKFEKTKFYVLGPDIMTLDGNHQNPQRKELLSKNELNRTILNLKIKLILNYIGIEKIINQAYKTIKQWVCKNRKYNVNFMEEQENVQLHGACLIFSPLYINKFIGLYEKTFMFMEEDILYYTLLQEKFKSLYSPEIKIIHKEDGSTNYIYGKDRKKRMFIYKNMLLSSKIYLHFINNYETEKNNFVEKNN
ncbi:glycosyltransferase [Clostridium colicanis]|uniref:N-glycosyltransferase n=1 Tax=Clostridium colicanis DSM 13634 TaxID=1121305 RepID=A0A151AK06_9CLOT|nr:glycosyltransferase [Clostridium colicanis]KYH27961.1 N-glycosyltransferase [Clostridium colicanis DSM 13634]